MEGNTNIIHKGAVAVITGGASGIGLAAAKFLSPAGVNIVLVDISSDLDAAVKEVKSIEGAGDVVGSQTDVAQVSQVIALRDKVLDLYGEVQILLNNAGVGRATPAFSLTRDLADLQADWATVLGVNMAGVINVAQVFAPLMARQENASVIINTGSKQGITTPPGNAGYNVSKAAVKVFTEQLAHELRNAPDSNCTAHLFVPGWVWTNMTARGDLSQPKPSGAWTAEQTVEYMFEHVLEHGDFYVICPDNETNTKLDKARIQWALGDIIENRPALSRWHPEYAARYEEFVSGRQGLAARSRSRGRPLDRIPDAPPSAPEGPA
ncbi:3-oxoacyl-[acyl-carrier-protein] reductase FabG [Vanrija pseudolonga]|uniref:3-oxoacyl-[acyl-carrier-protein] reductase FabG n=1 Tax=Vanrija pseudolonga TaxID=143232 RepID=A0AAF1BMY5_9TREE|nr:3-oxoacyl-[acyl-carrier-protein] reductase FabG [Vanrija pseudolonga]